MKKGLYNLLSNSGAKPISLSSTAGVDTFADPTISNDYSSEGIVYVEVAGFASATGTGFVPKLWESFNGGAWFLNTALPTSATAVSYSVHVDGLGKHLKASYATNVGPANGISTVRMTLEVFENDD